MVTISAGEFYNMDGDLDLQAFKNFFQQSKQLYPGGFEVKFSVGLYDRRYNHGLFGYKISKQQPDFEVERANNMKVIIEKCLSDIGLKSRINYSYTYDPSIYTRATTDGFRYEHGVVVGGKTLTSIVRGEVLYATVSILP